MGTFVPRTITGIIGGEEWAPCVDAETCRQFGLLPRLFPSRTALRIESGLARLISAAVKPLWVPDWLLSNLQAWWIGIGAARCVPSRGDIISEITRSPNIRWDR